MMMLVGVREGGEVSLQQGSSLRQRGERGAHPRVNGCGRAGRTVAGGGWVTCAAAAVYAGTGGPSPTAPTNNRSVESEHDYTATKPTAPRPQQLPRERAPVYNTS